MPLPSTFKVNVDCVTSTEGVEISGVGVVIREEEGRVVAALNKLLPSHYPAD